MLASFTGGNLPRRAIPLRRSPLHGGGRSLSLLLSESFKNEKCPPNQPLSPVRRPGGEKNASIRPLLRKTAGPCEKNMTIPPPWCAKKNSS